MIYPDRIKQQYEFDAARFTVPAGANKEEARVHEAQLLQSVEYRYHKDIGILIKIIDELQKQRKKRNQPL